MVCAQVIGNDVTVTIGRRQRQLRAQRDDAGDRPQRARVDPAARERARACWPTAASTASPPTRTGCARTPSRRRRSSLRSTCDRLREAAKVAKQALKEGTTIRETVIAMGFVERGELTEAQLDEALDVESMTTS